ncbi:hypothetical protein BC351_24790 [Paenibacillus ferrarius]|uniref:Uncharacterized protein n=1 Tax=Paenibacillus ferrarius TaxID=1469647 RepID=A0A1V4HMQ8_9BACL|nr:S-layer homology domain-containing protein [Paenibacillus ferrarius]OPH58158.1 hypothetical protein BC351_24790 [Paenibacillus ferrarius]
MIPKKSQGKRKNKDRIRRTAYLLLAVILWISLLSSGGGNAWAASGWSMIDGGGSNGLNVNSANRAEYPAMAVWKGEVYVAWQEKVVPGVTANQIRVKKYNGTNWVSVDGNGTNGLNMNSAKVGTRPTLAVFNGSLYLSWVEAVTSSNGQIRVKKYNGGIWTNAEGESTTGINVDPTKDAIFPALVEYNNALYASWSEAGKIYVKKYNGEEWTSVDGGPNGLNINQSGLAAYPALAVLGNDLIAVWSEVSGTTYQLRAKKYSGTSWTIIDGGTTGLNMVSGKSALYPSVAAIDGALYLAWNEPVDSATDDQIRVKKYDGNAWSSIDGGGKYGINVNSAFRANYVKLTTFNHDVYAVWQENSGMVGSTAVFKIRAKKYDGTSWMSAEAGSNGLIVDSSKVANYPAVTALNNVLYVAWQEKNSTIEQLRAANYAVPVPPAVNGVTVTPGTASVAQGGSRQLTVAVDAVGGAATTVTWTSSDASNKVAVSGAGNVTVAADATLGDYTITAISTVDNSKKGTATITVTAMPPAVNSVTVSPSTASVVQGGSKQLTASVDAVGGAATTVMWTSSDSSNKLAVDSAGNVDVAADATLGNYTITATSTVNNSKKGTATITVTAAPAINSVTVSPTTASVVQGGSKQLTASVDAVGGAATTVAWTSSDSSDKVAVDSAGNVTVATDAEPADYTITATSTVNNSKKGTATITVTAAPAINSVTVSPTTASVVQGGSKQLTASVDAVGGAATTVAWASSDSSDKVAVDSAGNVTVAAGTALGDYTITATSTVDNSKKGTATITVTAAPVISSVTVSPSTASVVQGGSKQLTASVDAVGGAVTTVTWTSNDAKVAVDNAGNVTVAANTALGDYTVTASSTVDNSKKGTATITVTAAPAINSVTVSPSTASVVQGGSKQLTASVDAVGGAVTTVTWKSNDAKVAVDSAGNVTVAEDTALGDYTVTASSTVDNSKKGTTTITVTAASSYKIAAITNQTLTALTQGYDSGNQETRSIAVTNIGTGNLTHLSVTLSGANANDFVMTQLDSTLAGSASTSFEIHAKNNLPANTYTATVTVSADHMTPVTFIVTQVVNLPNAPANPQNLAADVGDRQINLSWSTGSDATQYHIYMATDADLTNIVEIATVTSSTYSIQNLVNGTRYYFVVKAENSGGLSAASNQVSATPATIPGAPANVTAVAGNGQAVVTFTAPADNGGSAITGYEVTASPGNVVVIGDTSPITLTGLTNGTSYTFTVKAINGAGRSAVSAESNTVIPRGSDRDTDTPSQPSTPTTTDSTNTTNTPNTGVDILVNGKVENAGTATVTKRNNQTEMTVVVDQKKLDERLAAEGQHAVVTIPINQTFDIVIGELNGQMVKNMEDKQAVLEFKTDHATYTLPARQINIGAISQQVGELINLQDIKVRIEIAVPTTDTLKVVESAAAKGQLTLAAQPLNFTVRAAYGERNVEVTKFDAYVERTIAIPVEVDPGKITTGVVVEQDGSVRHVPTKVRNINGKYEAQINSLTNSTYAVVWHPLEFSDAANHWAKSAVNDMGSRMVVNGTGNGMFSPDQEITRAEFAAIIVRGLGLKLENGATPFSDVKSEDWYSGAVSTAYSHRLISGMEDGTFRPNDKITREQAMVILSKAMAITGLKDKLLEQSADSALRPFEDAAVVSSWAQSSAADNVKAGIVDGRNGALLAPKGYMTRAEVATIIQRLLQKSGLI